MSVSEEDVEIEKEVKDFNFRHLCKLRIGPVLENFNDRFNHLVVSNKHGLIFAVSSTDIKVVSLATLETISITNVNVNDAVLEFDHHTIPTGVNIENICLNCDETNLIIIYKDGSGLQIGAIDVSILNSQDKSNAIYASMTIDTLPDTFAKDIRRHPESPSSTAVCLSTGQVFVVELADNKFGVSGSLTQGPRVCSVCWSPKGKQIVIGLADGQLIQYDKTLKTQKKVTARPPIFDINETKEVGGLFWISAYVFMVIYNSPDLSEGPVFAIVLTQKDGPPRYTIMDDIYFGFNEERLLCYYFSYIPEWQVSITMASNAMEAVPVGVINSKWYRWGLQDTGRAEIPLSIVDNSDAFTVGTGICLTSSLGIRQDDKELPPAPVFAMLSTDGVLCTYQMVNQFPNINHGILTKAAPIPNIPPKKGTSPLILPPAVNTVINAPPPNVTINPDAPPALAPIATPGLPSFLPPNKTITSAENSGSAFKFNFSGTALSSAVTPPVSSAGIKFVTPVQSSPNMSMFSKPNPQVSTPNFSFNFSGNLGSGRASPANIPVSSQPTMNKPLFNLNPAAPAFKNTGFCFTAAPVEPASSPKPVAKPPVSITDNTIPNKPPEMSFKPTEQNKFSFTPVVRPFETASDPSKSLFQPVAQQQAVPVKPQVVSLASDKAPNFGQVAGTANIQQPPLQRVNSPALGTPNKPITEKIISTPQPTSVLVKNDTSPTVNPEIEQHAAKWNTTLQKNICEEISNFNAELEAFKKSCSGISCEDLVGSHKELVQMKNQITSLTNHMDEYKGVMKENKSECAMLRENVLKNLKMLDEATLLKQKMEDKRYSNAMKSRPLDPISARHRKALRAHINQVEQLLNDINVSLDTKWEERIAQRRNTRNKTSSIAKRQQVYQTIDAIDQITNNLASRLKKISLQSQENSVLMMNVTRKSTSDENTIQKSPNKNRNKSSSTNSPMKLKQLKSFLNSRGQTPLRKSKPYSSLIIPKDGEQNLNPSFSSFPKAASTPFPVQNGDPKLSDKHPLSNTLASLGNKSMTPTVLKSVPDTLANLKVPDNTPTTPVTINSQPSKPTVQFNMSKNDISYDLVTKNLFGTPPLSTNISTKPKIVTVSSNINTPSTEKNADATVKSSLPNPFIGSAVDPKNFWGKSTTSKPATDQYPHIKFVDIPTGDSPESNEAEPPFLSSSTTGFNLATCIPDAGNEVVAPSLKLPPPPGSDLTEDQDTTSNTDVASTIAASDESEERTIESTDESPIDVPKDSLPSSLTGSFPGFITTSKPASIFGIPNISSTPGKPLFGGPVSSSGLVSTSTGSLFGGGAFSMSASTADTAPVGTTTAAPTISFIPPTTGGLFGASSTSGNIFSATPKNSTPDITIASGNVFSAASSGLPGTVSTTPTTEVSEESPTDEIAVSTAPSDIKTSATPSVSSTGIFSSIVLPATSTSVVTFGGKDPSTTPVPGLFGSSNVSTATGGLFGSTATTMAPTGGLFGATATTSASGGLFGGTTTVSATSGLFGGATTAATSGGLFGTTSSAPANSGLFGSSISTTSTGGLFGTTTTSPAAALFGSTTTTSATGGLFGATMSTPATGGIFGAATAPTSATGNLFGVASTPATGFFGSTVSAATTTSAATGGIFGAATTTPASGGIFGSVSTTPASGGLFGATTSTSASGGLFGTPAPTSASGGLFGAATTTPATGSLFGAATSTSTSGGIFGTATSTPAPGGIFGAAATTPASGGLFGAATSTAASGSIFGGSGGLFKTPTSSAGGIFGGTGSGVFGSQSAASTPNIFASATTTNTSAFGSTGFGASTQQKEGGGFGGFGLGGGPVNDPNKNPFGAVASSPGSSTANIFGGGSTTSAFGQTTATQLGSGSFSKGFGSGISSSGFGAPAFGTSPAPAPAPAFGGAPAFGSPPAFGSSPSFGGAPTFGTSPPSGTFGSGSTFGSASTFGTGSVFGGGSALPSFGSLASGGTSTPAFGAPAAAPPPPAFGFGEAANPTPSGQQFSSWR